jgi:hypothetical protein
MDKVIDIIGAIRGNNSHKKIKDRRGISEAMTRLKGYLCVFGTLHHTTQRLVDTAWKSARPIHRLYFGRCCSLTDGGTTTTGIAQY